MGTRLYYQTFIETNFQDIGRVRVWPDPQKPWIANIYIEDKMGNYSEYIREKVLPKLEEVREIGTQFAFKPYSELATDNIPPEPELPEKIKQLALIPINTRDMVKYKLTAAFPELGDFELYTPLEPGVIGVKIKNQIDS
ncbi:MAG: hypothetical protein AB1652_05770, partial [Bacillota bacterium]